MKKLVKALTAIGTAAVAIVGGVYIFRKFFAKDEELDDAFDDEELFDEDKTDESVSAFDDETEIFEDETADAAPAEEDAADPETEAAAEEPGEEKEV